MRNKKDTMHRTIMILSSFLVLSLLMANTAFAQADSGTVVVHKDPRIDELVRKQIQINEETTRDSRRNIPGFRIQVINSTDRNKVFAAKTRIYQEFPDLKPYLLYQAPNYKLRVGNFRTQEEAEDFEKQLARLFPSGLFIIRDVIEVSPNDMPLPNP
jgi:hypothetical protein